MIREWAPYALLLAFAGCAAARADTAEAGYLGQQLACVDKYDTRADIDKCRAEVKARWSKDAGHE